MQENHLHALRLLVTPSTILLTELEKIESLEQLRVLHNGYKIGVTITQNAPSSGVDTQEDLNYVRSVWKD